MDESKTLSSDHDLIVLIVEIKTELKLFREETRTTNNDTKERLIKLGENKVEKDTFGNFLSGMPRSKRTTKIASGAWRCGDYLG